MPARINKPAGKNVTAPKEKAVKLSKVVKPTEAARELAAKTATERLMATVSEFKDVQGKGTETAGKGDPRVSERRLAVSALLAGPKPDEVKAALEALGPNVQNDVKWVLSAERQDYQQGATDNGFWWAANDMISSATVQGSFDRRIQAGKTRAQEIEQGTKKFFDASDNGVAGLAFIADAGKRAASLADAVLQFRARTDPAAVKDARIDEHGPAMVGEQRVLLASLELGADDPAKLREYALVRELIASHPMSSGNAIFEARNAVGKLFLSETTSYWSKNHATAWVRWEVPPGATASPYASIHHNFSRDTPRNIQAFVNEWMFPKGPPAERGPVFVALVDALEQARGGDAPGARAALTALGAKHPEAAGPLAQTLGATADDKVADAVFDYLKGACVKDLGTKEPESNLEMAARLYRAVCQDRVTVDVLEKKLYRAGEAWPEVADVAAQLKMGGPLSALNELGEARLAMRDAIISAKTGFERQQLISFDADLNRLTCEELGASVERVGKLDTDAAKSEALLALRTALRSAVASGLHAIKDENDPAAKKGQPLDQVLAKVSEALEKRSISPDAYRELMSEAYVAVARTVQNLRSFFDARAGDLTAGGVQLDPMFADQLVKQTSLHYATALAERGMRVGLKEEIGPRRIANIEGMRVLNSIGPVVFPTVVVAENPKDLVKLNPPRDALTIVYKSDEKKMKMAGGLVVDTRDAPGGNSHLNMYAMNNGIPVVALPELSTKYAELFKRAETEGGLYVDDSNGQFQMMTVAYAKEQGLVTDATLEDLLPGTNRKIHFLKPNAAQDGFELFSQHEALISPNRPTRNIELFVPQEEVRGLGRKSASFTELATLGTLGRHLAGEKGLVLALLKGDPELSKYVPDGSIVTTGRVRGLLKEAGLAEEWDRLWREDPKVGTVDDSNFLQSAFYTDPAYRTQARERLGHLTMEKLTAHLIEQDGAGGKRLTAAGQALYDELTANPALQGSDNWIARSSYTGEDRPGKSGAGQYESFPNLKDPVSRIEGIIGVIESAWHAAPIENNVAEEINLEHIMPSIVVQHCLKPEISGVMISRNLESGARGQVSYQLVKGFGGGVEGGKAEEGVLSSAGVKVNLQYPGEPNGLASKDALEELRQVVLKVEKFFNDKVEPGKGHAVDMEVARVDGQWQVVQARVILMDK